MLLMSLIKPVEIRVTVAPVSISKFVITPFTFALINIPASGASLCTPTEPGVIDSLIDGDMRLRIKQARPINLNDAIRHAVELEAFNKAELKRNEGGGYLRSATEQENKDETATLLKTMQQALTDLQKEVKGLKSKQTPRDQNLRQCHACGKPGHIARFCPRGDVTCYGCG
jgi:hypothetical protein